MLLEERVKMEAGRLSYLRKKEYREHPHPLGGMCYIVSEALYWLDGDRENYTPMNVVHEGAQHWWLLDKRTGRHVDLTAEQFDTPVPYEQGVGRGFLTKTPSKRAQVIIEAVKNAKNGELSV